MRVLKFLCVFVLILCLIETCFVEAQNGPDDSDGRHGVRFVVISFIFIIVPKTELFDRSIILCTSALLRLSYSVHNSLFACSMSHASVVEG